MASSPKLFSLLFLILALSVQIHARSLFSKVSSFNTNVNNAKETTVFDEQRPENQKTELPNKEEQQYVTKQQQEPTFLPQTQTQSADFLYGLKLAQFPTETTTTTNNKVTYKPYVTPIRPKTFEKYPNNNNYNYNYYNNANYKNEQQQNLGSARFAESGSYRTTTTKDNGYYNNNGYNNNVERQGMSDTRFMENGKHFYDVKNKNNYYQNQQHQNSRVPLRNQYSYNTRGAGYHGYYNNNGYNNNVERRGMSDTRFMENGKHFYDVKNKNNYYQNQKYQNSRVPSRNQYSYNTRGAGYHGNKNANFYNPMFINRGAGYHGNKNANFYNPMFINRVDGYYGNNNVNFYNPMYEQRYENEENSEEVFEA